MLDKLLYYSNGLVDVKHKDIRYEEDSIIVVLEPEQKQHQCPNCHSSSYIFRGSEVKRVRTVPIGCKRCFLEIEMPRLGCKGCSFRWRPQPSFLAGKRRMTKAFQEYIMALTQLTTIKAVAGFTGVSWDTVKDIHKEYLQEMYKEIDYTELEYIGVDEFSIKKTFIHDNCD